MIAIYDLQPSQPTGVKCRAVILKRPLAPLLECIYGPPQTKDSDLCLLPDQFDYTTKYYTIFYKLFKGSIWVNVKFKAVSGLLRLDIMTTFEKNNNI